MKLSVRRADRKHLVWPRRLANKIVVLVLCLELISISVWGSLTYLGSRDELLRTISNDLSEVASRTTTTIGNFFVPVQTELQTLSELTASPLLSREQKRILFDRLLRRRPEVDSVSLVRANGHERWRVSRTRTFGPGDMRNLSHDALFHEAMNGHVATSSVSFSRYLDPQMRIATPVKSRGKVEGVIIAVVNLRGLWDTVQALPIGGDGHVYIVDSRRYLIADRDPSLVFSHLFMPRTTVPHAMFSGQGRHELLVYRSLSGKEVAGVSRFDPQHKWWVVVERPVDEALAPLHRVIQRFVLAFLMAATVTILIVVLFSRITMRPLEVLERAIAHLAAGARGVRVAIPGHSELANIASAFNSMSASLDQKIEGLETSDRRIRASEAALRDSERQVRLLLESTAEGIFGVSGDGRCMFCNPAGVKLLGYEGSGALIGRSMHELLHPALADGTPIPYEACSISHPEHLEGETHLGETVFTRADGTPFFAECWIRPVSSDGTLSGAVLTVLDATERHRYTAELEYQASHDLLTYLPNRHYLHAAMEEALAAEHGQIQPFSLLLIDLDRFKEVNDALGHKSGDQLLKQLGPRLRVMLEGQDVLARLGGDEFAILLRSSPSATGAQDIAARLRSAIQQPFDLDGMRVQIDASIGIALHPEHASDASELLRLADVAMYQAKQAGAGCALYDRDLDAHSPRRLALMTGLGRAIAEEQLVVHYQPQIRLSDGKVTAVEALVRWQHPAYGLLLPDQFVPLAELGELIKPMTLWVVERALQDWRRWRDEGRSLRIGVNISARNLHDADLPEKIAQLLAKHCLGNGCLELEITESAIMTDPVRALETMNALAELGVSLAIDDFGTGYSSLSYLKRLNADTLKIDKSFVRDIGGDENDEVIVRSTIELAHSLGLAVTAEGVESDLARQMLAELRCDRAQGFYICTPLPAAELTQWLDEHSAGDST